MSITPIKKALKELRPLEASIAALADFDVERLLKVRILESEHSSEQVFEFNEFFVEFLHFLTKTKELDKRMGRIGKLLKEDVFWSKLACVRTIIEICDSKNMTAFDAKEYKEAKNEDGVHELDFLTQYRDGKFLVEITVNACIRLHHATETLKDIFTFYVEYGI